MGDTILLVDDDPLLVRGLAYSLQRAGFGVHTASNAVDGVRAARTGRPDLVLLDIGLPGMDGLEAMGIFQRDLKLPVILLTARRSGTDEALGLELGADDYITKPYDMDRLLARIRATLLRQARLNEPSALVPLAVGDLKISPQTHNAQIGQHQLDLPPRVFDLLYALAARTGQVLSVETLLAKVWGAQFDGETQVIYVCISELRKKLVNTPGHSLRIVTVHGVGYMLVHGEP